MGTATLKESDLPSRDPEPVARPDLSDDPRWQLVERIIRSAPFQKSSRLPALFRYLALCSITGNRNGLTEQIIGRAVFHKPESYTPAEDSSVRVYVRQLRLRLHEYYQATDRSETLLVTVPKGDTRSPLSPLRKLPRRRNIHGSLSPNRQFHSGAFCTSRCSCWRHPSSVRRAGIEARLPQGTGRRGR